MAAAALLCMSVSRLLGSASCEQFPSIQSISLVDGSEYMTSIATDLLHSKNRDYTITSFSSLLSIVNQVPVIGFCHVA